MIVSIPFSATAVMNFSMTGSQYGLGRSPEKSIMAFQLFTVLWIIRGAFSHSPPWHRRGWFLTRRARLWLLAFLGAVVLSQCVPLVFNGTSWATSFEAIGGDFFVTKIPLRFTNYNVTQFLYLAFGIAITIFVAAENWRPDRVFYTLKLYVSSCIFVALWGLYQLWCYLSGHVYAAQVLNTSESLSARGYADLLATGYLAIGRITSATSEASDLSEELLFSFVVLLVCLALRRPILRRGWNWLGVILFGVVLFASTSSTAYFGAAVGVILAAISLGRVGSQRWRHVMTVSLTILLCVALLVAYSPFMNKMAQFAIAQKYVSGSGHTRMESVQVAAQSFLQHPILGAGWYNVQSSDLLFLILTNTGLFGLISFGAFLIPTLQRLWKLAGSRDFVAAVLLPATALAVIIAQGKGLTYGTGYVWFYLGLAAGAAAVKSDLFLEVRGRPAQEAFGTCRLNTA